MTVHRSATPLLLAALLLLLAACGPAAASPPAAQSTQTPSSTGAYSVTEPAYRLCQASSLRGVVELLGAAGQRAGQATLTNRGSLPCVLHGTPRTTIVRQNGQVLHVRQLTGNSGRDGAPVGMVELVPGQQAISMIQWSNYCGPIPGRTHLVMRIPGGGTLDVRPGGFDGPSIPVPPCLGPGQPSTLSVGGFIPPTEDPATAILTYYSDVNGRMYSLAYQMLGGRKPAFRISVAGYRHTAHVSVDLVATPLYRVYRPGATYACVGVRFTARNTHAHRAQFGGWYLISIGSGPSFSLIPSHSSIHANRPLVLPTRGACAANMP